MANTFDQINLTNGGTPGQPVVYGTNGEELVPGTPHTPSSVTGAPGEQYHNPGDGTPPVLIKVGTVVDNKNGTATITDAAGVSKTVQCAGIITYDGSGVPAGGDPSTEITGIGFEIVTDGNGGTTNGQAVYINGVLWGCKSGSTFQLTLADVDADGDGEATEAEVQAYMDANYLWLAEGTIVDIEGDDGEDNYTYTNDIDGQWEESQNPGGGGGMTSDPIAGAAPDPLPAAPAGGSATVDVPHIDKYDDCQALYLPDGAGGWKAPCEIPVKPASGSGADRAAAEADTEASAGRPPAEGDTACVIINGEICEWATYMHGAFQWQRWHVGEDAVELAPFFATPNLVPDAGWPHPQITSANNIYSVTTVNFTNPRSCEIVGVFRAYILGYDWGSNSYGNAHSAGDATRCWAVDEEVRVISSAPGIHGSTLVYGMRVKDHAGDCDGIGVAQNHGPTWHQGITTSSVALAGGAGASVSDSHRVGWANNKGEDWFARMYSARWSFHFDDRA